MAAEYDVQETDDQIKIVTPRLEAAVAKTGYVSGVKRQTFLDKKTGFRDPGFGLDIVDFLLEPAQQAVVHNKACRDFLSSKNTAAKHRRYVGKLYAKEVVLINFPHESPGQVMERLIELTLRTEDLL